MSVLHTSPRSYHRRRTALRAQALRSVAPTPWGAHPAGRAGAKPRTPQGSSLRSTAIAGALRDIRESPKGMIRSADESPKGIIAPTDPLTESLRSLKHLRDQGLLSEEEYKAKVLQLLKQPEAD